MRAAIHESFSSHPLSDVQEGKGSQARVLTIPRSREVGQSYLTSIWTTLISVWAALTMVYTVAPQLVRIATNPASMACMQLFQCAHQISACHGECSERYSVQVIVNGPGTCIPLCFAAHLFRHVA